MFQNGQTPLMVAAEQGNLDIVQELIRRGANVNLDDVVSIYTHTNITSQNVSNKHISANRDRWYCGNIKSILELRHR